MHIRQCLLAAPVEAYLELFDGKIPSLQERIHAVELAVQSMTAIHIYRNDIYTVRWSARSPFIHLAIQRNDGRPCFHWRDFQEIKNRLVGPENEAIEIFPAESRLVDSSNQYHLWVYADPHYRIPAGFNHRFVTEEPLQEIAMRARHALPSHASMSYAAA